MVRLGLGVLLVVLSVHITTAEISTSNFEVVSYTLDLTIPNTTMVGSPLNGQAVITLTCKNSSAPIVLNWGSSLLPTTPTATDIIVTSQSSTDTTATPVTLTVKVDQDVVKQSVTLTPDPTYTIPVGDTVTVSITYQTTVNAEASGIFMMSFPDGNQIRSFVATNAWPTSARDILPCVDQPDVAADWTVTLTRPTAWDLVTTLENTTTIPDETAGTTTDTLSGTSLPSNHLAIFLSGGAFAKTSQISSTTKTPFNFWAKSALSGTTVLTNTISTLTQLFSTIDNVITNSLTSIDIVLVPNLPQPFSAPGIIYVREESYNLTNVGQVRSVVMPIVWHYIKQYTLFSTRPASWADYWFSDAITGFLEYSLLANIFPDLDLSTELSVVIRQSALAMDSFLSSSPLMDLSIDTDSPAAIESSLMDPLKKLKGTAVLNMLDMSFPAGSILKAIQTLLNSKKNTPVTSTQVLDTLTAALSAESLTTAQTQILDGVNTWFTTAGYPLLTPSVSNYGTPSNVSLALSAYCELAPCDNSVSGYVVPTNIGSKSDTRYLTPRQDLVVVTSGSTTTINLTVNSGDWIASNMQSTGYYRVNYTTANWQLIRKAIASNYSEIPGISQILDDSLALSLSGLLPFSESLPLVTANTKHAQFENWYPIYSNLWRLRTRLLDTDIYSYFEDFARMVLQDLAAVLEGNTLKETEKEQMLALVFEGLCEFNINNYRTEAISGLTDILQGNLVSSIGLSSYDALVCCGAQHSSSLDADYLRSAITNSTASFYVRHYNAIALGCLANYTAISEQISSLIPDIDSTTQTRASSTSGIENKPFIVTVYQSIVEKHPLAFVDSLTTSSLIKLQSLLGAAQVASLITKVGVNINNATEISKLNSITSSSGIDAMITKAVLQTESEVKLKVSWLEQNNASLTSALQSNTVVSSGLALNTLFSLSCMLPVMMYLLKAIIV